MNDGALIIGKRERKIKFTSEHSNETIAEEYVLIGH